MCPPNLNTLLVCLEDPKYAKDSPRTATMGRGMRRFRVEHKLLSYEFVPRPFVTHAK